MNEVIKELRDIVAAYSRKFLAFSDQDFAVKPNPTKWSRKEVVGHLIDSGQNNLRRFIVGQYDHQPLVIYEQNFWVNASNYQQAKKEDVIELWRLINNQICAVLVSMPRENYSMQANTSRTTTPELHPLEWLAADYVKHMKHHINQVIAGSFDIVYP